MSHSPIDAPDWRTGTAEPTESDRHRMLAAARRRAVLDVLDERATPVELDELAATIADREEAPTLPDDELERRVAISLHHLHLPLMTEVGAIDYDPASTRVESVGSPVDRRQP